MGGLPIPESLPVSNVHSVFAEDGSLLNAFDAKARRLIDDLCWYARRMKGNGDHIASGSPVNAERDAPSTRGAGAASGEYATDKQRHAPE